MISVIFNFDVPNDNTKNGEIYVSSMLILFVAGVIITIKMIVQAASGSIFNSKNSPNITGTP
ncbi:hypothetical protein PPE03_07520 [Pseudoalteromonas peptidolytica]|nr:hypothetical protein PPE03_07520 [Pseudoalteromonas peptidolytica]